MQDPGEASGHHDVDGDIEPHWQNGAVNEVGHPVAVLRQFPGHGPRPEDQRKDAGDDASAEALAGGRKRVQSRNHQEKDD